MMTAASVSAGKLGSYYAKEEAAQNQNYYAKEGGQGPEIVGSGKEIFNIKNLTMEKFEALSNGRKLKAKDLTFSAPKSVSLAYHLGDERVKKDMAESHIAAVRAALDHIESSGLFCVQKKKTGRKRLYKQPV